MSEEGNKILNQNPFELAEQMDKVIQEYWKVGYIQNLIDADSSIVLDKNLEHFYRVYRGKDSPKLFAYIDKEYQKIWGSESKSQQVFGGATRGIDSFYALIIKLLGSKNLNIKVQTQDLEYFRSQMPKLSVSPDDNISPFFSYMKVQIADNIYSANMREVLNMIQFQEDNNIQPTIPNDQLLNIQQALIHLLKDNSITVKSRDGSNIMLILEKIDVCTGTGKGQLVDIIKNIHEQCQVASEGKSEVDWRDYLIEYSKVMEEAKVIKYLYNCFYYATKSNIKDICDQGLESFKMILSKRWRDIAKYCEDIYFTQTDYYADGDEYKQFLILSHFIEWAGQISNTSLDPLLKNVLCQRQNNIMSVFKKECSVQKSLHQLSNQYIETNKNELSFNCNIHDTSKETTIISMDGRERISDINNSKFYGAKHKNPVELAQELKDLVETCFYGITGESIVNTLAQSDKGMAKFYLQFPPKLSSAALVNYMTQKEETCLSYTIYNVVDDYYNFILKLLLDAKKGHDCNINVMHDYRYYDFVYKGFDLYLIAQQQRINSFPYKNNIKELINCDLHNISNTRDFMSPFLAYLQLKTSADTYQEIAQDILSRVVFNKDNVLQLTETISDVDLLNTKKVLINLLEDNSIKIGSAEDHLNIIYLLKEIDDVNVKKGKEQLTAVLNKIYEECWKRTLDRRKQNLCTMYVLEDNKIDEDLEKSEFNWSKCLIEHSKVVEEAQVINYLNNCLYYAIFCIKNTYNEGLDSFKAIISTRWKTIANYCKDVKLCFIDEEIKKQYDDLFSNYPEINSEYGKGTLAGFIALVGIDLTKQSKVAGSKSLEEAEHLLEMILRDSEKYCMLRYSKHRDITHIFSKAENLGYLANAYMQVNSDKLDIDKTSLELLKADNSCLRNTNMADEPNTKIIMSMSPVIPITRNTSSSSIFVNSETKRILQEYLQCQKPQYEQYS